MIKHCSYNDDDNASDFSASGDENLSSSESK